MRLLGSGISPRSSGSHDGRITVTLRVGRVSRTRASEAQQERSSDQDRKSGCWSGSGEKEVTHRLTTVRCPFINPCCR